MANTLFGYTGHKRTDISKFTKWTNVLSKHWGYTEKWNHFCSNVDPSSVESVNTYVNICAQYKRDIGKDNWATPEEFITRLYGDCEDFAITKFFLLISIGLCSPHELELVVVHDKEYDEGHAILLYKKDDINWILDIAQMNTKIEIDTDIKRYKPYYSIDLNNWWRYKK